jgi:hypothetical protein
MASGLTAAQAIGDRTAWRNARQRSAAGKKLKNLSTLKICHRCLTDFRS